MLSRILLSGICLATFPLVKGANLPEVFQRDVCNADNCLRAVSES